MDQFASAQLVSTLEETEQVSVSSVAIDRARVRIPLCYYLLPFRRLGIFRSLHRRPCSLSCINEYLAIDSGGNVSDLVLARNCCLARMLPGEAENGVGMNRSVREGKKCEAL